MANFIFSAFADEIDSNFEEQLKALKELNIGLIELRGVNGKSFIELSDEEVNAVKEQLDSYGIGISALGTPIGKITVDGDFEAHKKLLTRIMDIGDVLGCKVLRMFSFYPAEGMADDTFKSVVFDYIQQLLEMASARGATRYAAMPNKPKKPLCSIDQKFSPSKNVRKPKMSDAPKRISAQS